MDLRKAAGLPKGFALGPQTLLAALSLLMGCDWGSEPKGLEGLGYCDDAEHPWAYVYSYDARDSLVRSLTYRGKDGNLIYETTIAYENGLRVSSIGKGVPPGPGRPDHSTFYTYDSTGSLVEMRDDFGGGKSCTDYARLPSSRAIEATDCDTHVLQSVSYFDSLGRQVADTVFSPERAVQSYGITEFGDSGWVIRYFRPAQDPDAPVETWTYGSRGELLSLRQRNLSDSAWETTVYTREGSLETFETLTDAGNRIDKGYSDLSRSGKPLKTVRCYDY